MAGYKNLLLFLFQILCLAAVGQSIPPRIVNWKTSREEFVPPSTASFACEARGTGNLEFEWLKNGEMLVKSNSKYTVTVEENLGTKREKFEINDVTSRLRPEEEGYYQCRVRNAHGVALSNVTWLRNFRLEAGKSDVKTAEVNVGDSTKLLCPEKALSSSPGIEWIKMASDESPDRSSAKAIVMDGRVQIDESGSLVFSYVYLNDKTEVNEVYKCVLKNSIDLVTSVVGSQYRLSVNDIPRPAPTTLSTLIASVVPSIAIAGRDVTLQCFFSGEQVTISFYDKNGHHIQSTSSSPVMLMKSKITIKNVSKSMEGKYSCTGSSTTGLTKTETLNIVVQSRPVFQAQPRDQNATHGSFAEFRCQADAEPQTKIQWYKNGIPLDENSLPNKMQLSHDKTSLKIHDLCKEKCPSQPDLMVIQCNASNVHGYAFANGYLNVLFKTEITKKPTDVEYNHEEVADFTCEATTDPDTKLTYKWLFNDKPFTHGSIDTSSNHLRLDLPRLEDKGSNLIGKWTCEASNSYTTERQSAYLKAKYIPAWPYWWVVLLALLLFLLLLSIICIICCCLYRNRGDQYPVDEIEQKNGNDPEKELEEAGFHDYQRDPLLPRSDSATGTLSSQDRTISRQKRSQGSLTGTLGRGSDENISG